jgi:hypothetical protein
MTAVSGFRGPLTATLVTTGLAASFAASSADAQQPLREGCRGVSRLECTTNRKRNLRGKLGGCKICLSSASPDALSRD